MIFGITAALFGEITIKGGRVEQGNFDTYQMLRIDEAPKIEVCLIDGNEAPLSTTVASSIPAAAAIRQEPSSSRD